MKKFTLIIALFIAAAFTANAQIVVVPDTNTVELVNGFILSGVSASNVEYTGADSTLGTFSGGGECILGMNEGIVLTTGSLGSGGINIGDPVSSFSNFYNSAPGDPQLDALISGVTTYDASVLEFDLEPVGNILEFTYVFASEEYPEFVGSSFNDVFGFFIFGPNPEGGDYDNINIALIPYTDLPVAINNVNATSNPEFYIDNEALASTDFVFDGLTTELIAKVNVVPSQTYHLKMAIADAGDGVYDSNIFLKAQSMKSYNSTEISEIAISENLVYPNPVNESSVMNIPAAGVKTIRIIDYTGAVIDEISPATNGNNMLSIKVGKVLENKPNGMYFIQVMGESGVEVVKVVK
ncbi:MAG: hypothetical protein A2W91_19155 [Bacteroidetes bacterium GWF2_38_335]|nr:MAG: hypothetical protein A2W91_19155 [Bacteroidetes bacterium GWF2_38_335]HBS86333.1 hypothetical protein [Bacteroidales bacterium]